MHIVTLACPSCETVVAANELEKQRVMKCPGLDCEEVLRFDDLPESDREHVLDNLDQYKMD
ncbi:MAG: hypothetical protein ACOCYZ_06615 [Halococcoides sp.]